MKETYMKFSDTETNYIKKIEKGSGEIKICILSLIHGNEFAGLQYNNSLLSELNPQDKAKIISIPIINPDGYLRNDREHRKYGDLNRHFLEKVDSSEPVKYLEYLYENYFSKADLVIDLHSYNKKNLEPFVILDQINSSDLSEEKAKKMRNKNLTLSKKFQLPIIEDDHRQRGYISELLVNKSEVPTIRVELGQDIVTDYDQHEEVTEKLKNGINYVINNYSSWQQSEKPESYENYYKRKYIRSKLSGDIINNVKEKEQVEKGDIIAYIKTDSGKEIEIEAPEDGWVVHYSENKKISEQENDICQFAIKREQPDLIY